MQRFSFLRLPSVREQGKTMAEKLLSRAAGADLKSGDVVICEPHVAMGTDGSIPMALEYLRPQGRISPEARSAEGSPMSARPLSGRARVLGDDVNTDYLISSRRKKESLDPRVLRRFLLEDVDPGFARSVMDGDILVAGRNFGCGSAMEVAVTVVLGAGIRAVVAKSYSRTYWRNAINNGLLALVADTSGIAEGDALLVRLDGQTPELRVMSQPSRRIACEPMPEFMLALRDAGGLVPYLRLHGKLA